MKHCPACHAELPDGAIGCPNCGGAYLPDGHRPLAMVVAGATEVLLHLKPQLHDLARRKVRDILDEPPATPRAEHSDVSALALEPPL